MKILCSMRTLVLIATWAAGLGVVAGVVLTQLVVLALG
jgi:hypothetical protein